MVTGRPLPGSLARDCVLNFIHRVDYGSSGTFKCGMALPNLVYDPLFFFQIIFMTAICSLVKTILPIVFTTATPLNNRQLQPTERVSAVIFAMG